MLKTLQGSGAVRKARILQAGDFDADGFPIGWVFESVLSLPNIVILPNGEYLLGGYTVGELRELFNNPPLLYRVISSALN